MAGASEGGTGGAAPALWRTVMQTQTHPSTDGTILAAAQTAAHMLQLTDPALLTTLPGLLATQVRACACACTLCSEPVRLACAQYGRLPLRLPPLLRPVPTAPRRAGPHCRLHRPNVLAFGSHKRALCLDIRGPVAHLKHAPVGAAAAAAAQPARGMPAPRLRPLRSRERTVGGRRACAGNAARLLALPRVRERRRRRCASRGPLNVVDGPACRLEPSDEPRVGP